MFEVITYILIITVENLFLFLVTAKRQTQKRETHLSFDVSWADEL